MLRCLAFAACLFLAAGGPAATDRAPFGIAASDAELSGPAVLDLTIRAHVAVEAVLDGEELRAANREAGIPEDTPPTLRLWSADLMDHFGQHQVERIETDPEPTEVWIDPEHGNRVLYFDLTDRLAAGTTLTVTRRYRLRIAAYVPEVDAGAVPDAYDPADPQFVLYTKSEPFLELTDDITSAAAAAVAETTHPVDQARAIFEWVRGHMTYEYPPPGGRGALVALERARGDCGQYADLFIALCRSRSIPARFAGGFNIGRSAGGTTGTIGSHAWAEMLLPDGRWLPVDPTGEASRYFLRKDDPRHITATVGRNILLPHVPDWATWQSSEVEKGRTPFMQWVTEHRSGSRGRLTMERRAEFSDVRD